MKRIKNLIVLILIAVFVSLSLTGCKGDSEQEAPEAPSAEEVTE